MNYNNHDANYDYIARRYTDRWDPPVGDPFRTFMGFVFLVVILGTWLAPGVVEKIPFWPDSNTVAEHHDWFGTDDPVEGSIPQEWCGDVVCEP